MAAVRRSTRVAASASSRSLVVDRDGGPPPSASSAGPDLSDGVPCRSASAAAPAPRGSAALESSSRSWVPSATTRPSSSSTTRSASAIVAGRWAMTIVVRPRITSVRASRISCSLVGSTERVASSRISTRGSARIARAMAMRWRWPPESEKPALADQRVVALRQRGDELVGPGEPRGPLHQARRAPRGRRTRCWRAIVSVKRNVSSNTMPTARRSSRTRSVADVDAVEEDAARVDVVEARDQPGDRGLAAAGRADERDRLARAELEVEVVAAPVARRRRRSARPRSGPRRGRAPAVRGQRARVGASTITGAVESTSSTRCDAAAARWAWAMIMPSIRSGQMSIST